MSRVLVLSPHPELSELLRDAGHSVVPVELASEALELAESRLFDVVVVDARLLSNAVAPWARMLRVRDPGPALIVCGASPEHQALRGQGMLAVIGDPLRSTELLDLVAAARRDALIALVEDDLLLADNLQEIFAQAGFTIVHAPTLAAVSSLPQLPFVAAVVDLRLPDGRDGEALDRLAARFPGLPLIVASALDIDLPMQTQGYLFKPVNAGRLLGLIERLRAPARPPS